MMMWWFSNGDIGKGTAGKEDERNGKWTAMKYSKRTYIHKTKKKHTYTYSIDGEARGD